MFEAFVYWLRKKDLFLSRDWREITATDYTFPVIPLGETEGKHINLMVECYERKVIEHWLFGLIKREYDDVEYVLSIGPRLDRDRIMFKEKIPQSIFFYGHLNGTTTKRWLQCNLVLIRNGTFQPTPSVCTYNYDDIQPGDLPQGPAG